MDCEVNMREDLLMLKDPCGRLLVQVSRSPNRLYKMPMEVEYPKYLQIQEIDVTWTWHARLEHMNFGVMKNMVDKEMIVGMPHVIQEKDVCSACVVGKQTRKSFSPKAKYQTSHALELVHGDFCGLISLPTPANNRYVFALIDDYSRYMWTMLLKKKSEAFDPFKKFKEYVENQTKLKLKIFRTDRGGEFTSSEFIYFCEENGVTKHLTTLYTPQQNGVVERGNRTLMEMTRSLMKGMKIPNQLWGDAVHHSTYLINRIAIKALENKTPYEGLYVKKPNIKHLRVFG